MILDKFKVLDFHAHVYPDKIAEKATIGTAKFYNVRYEELGTLDHLLNNNDFTDKYVIHSSATTPEQVDNINKFIYESSLKDDRIIGFGTIHPYTKNKRGVIQNICSLKFPGIKLHPDIMGIPLDDPGAIEIYKLCEEYGLIVLLHTGDVRFDFSNPNRLKPVCESFENLKIVGAHFGGYTMWEKATMLLKGTKNLMVDLSSTMELIPSETVERLIDAYGVENVLYGSDFPVNDPNNVMNLFNKLHLSDEEKQKILYNNAAKLLNIG